MRIRLLFCSLLLSACGDSSGPGSGPLPGRYELVLVDNKPLPTVLETFLSGNTYQVAEGALQFSGGLALQQTHYDMYNKTTGFTESAGRDSSRGAFQLKDMSTLIVTHNINGVPKPDTGYVDGDVIIIQQQLKTSFGTFAARKAILKYQKQ